MTLSTGPKFRSGLPPLLAGLLLAGVGWVSGVNFVPETLESRPQLVVSPAGAKITTERGAKPVLDRDIPGLYHIIEPDLELDLSYKEWPKAQVKMSDTRGVTTVRLAPPRATLSVAVKGDPKVEAQFFTLPKKVKLKSVQGQVRLEPGRHELLLEAEGYLPQRLSIDLEPGQRKVMTAAMTAIPVFPQAGFQPQGLPTGPLPSFEPPVYRPPVAQPQPTYRPPPPPPVQPMPRFTPIPPVAQPARDVPVPMFTPLGR